MREPAQSDIAEGILPYDHDDELIAATLADGRPRLRLYRPAGVQVVLGRGSDPDRELHLATCRADGVPLFRRRGGGYAVVLDPGNLVVAIVLAVPGVGRNREYFERLSSHVIAALARAGQPGVYREGASDLVLAGRKVGGGSIYRRKGLLGYWTTVLIEPDVALLERYLKHPSREPAYRRGRAHREFVGALGAGFRSEEFAAALAAVVDQGAA